MPAVPAVIICAALIAAIIAAGVGIDRITHPAPKGAFANCDPQAQIAPGQFAGLPKMCIDPSRNYEGTIVTTKGQFSFVFLTKSNPITSNNFIVLAVNHYFDGLKFFKVESWEVQAGDPENSGRGGPGYSLPPEPPGPTDQWVPGSLGMARHPDGSLSGSQFFVLRTAWKGGDPSAVYNHFATITSGFDIVGQLDSTDRILQVQIKRS